MMDNVMESGNVGRTFPNMRTNKKPSSLPLVFRVVMRMNVRLLVVFLFFCFGALFYVGASTSLIIVFVFSVCILSTLVLHKDSKLHIAHLGIRSSRVEPFWQAIYTLDS